MKEHWFFFLSIALVCVFIEGFFSAFEMACVSFSKIRLEYYANKKEKRAIWLKSLLNKPSYLFGTTLIVINTVLQIGSEASRRFYESIDISPDFAPLTQVIIVLIFGELAPLFAARRHSEHVAYATVPVVYFISRLLTPFVYIIMGISYLVNRLFTKVHNNFFFFTREEIERAFEDKTVSPKVKEQEKIIGNIFSFKNKRAKDIMIKLKNIQMISSKTKLADLRNVLSADYTSFIPVYHISRENIVAIAYPRDLLRLKDEERVMNFSRSPWFITDDIQVIQILQQFRHNNQSLAVVLNSQGEASGILSLDQIIDDIFGQEYELPHNHRLLSKVAPYIERTLPGDTLISEFNKNFNARLSFGDAKTLSDLVTAVLKHHPSEGEIIKIDNFEITVIEPSLLGAKSLLIKTTM
jgi:CBS domain containing-hemolysin-like protein